MIDDEDERCPVCDDEDPDCPGEDDEEPEPEPEDHYPTLDFWNYLPLR